MAAQAGVALTFKAPALRDLESRMAGAADATKHPRVLMNRVGAVLESSTRTRFRTGLSPEGRPWKPSIRVRTKGGKTLVEHAHLRDSISHDADDRKAEVGSNLIYAAIHQLGGVIRAKAGGFLTFNIPGIGWRRVASVTIPARPYLGVSDDDRLNVADQVESYLQKALRA